VRLTRYDGVNCIGGNKMMIEDGDRLVFDFGKNVGVEGSKRPKFRNSNRLDGRFLTGIASWSEFGGLWGRFQG
jgi:hypothetical protein